MFDLRKQIPDVAERIKFIKNLERLYIITYQDPALRLVVTSMRQYMMHRYDLSAVTAEFETLRHNEPTGQDFEMLVNKKLVPDASIIRLLDYYRKVFKYSQSIGLHFKVIHEFSFKQCMTLNEEAQSRGLNT